jgi:hypothetical protein
MLCDSEYIKLIRYFKPLIGTSAGAFLYWEFPLIHIIHKSTLARSASEVRQTIYPRLRFGLMSIL